MRRSLPPAFEQLLERTMFSFGFGELDAFEIFRSRPHGEVEADEVREDDEASAPSRASTDAWWQVLFLQMSTSSVDDERVSEESRESSRTFGQDAVTTSYNRDEEEESPTSERRESRADVSPSLSSGALEQEESETGFVHIDDESEDEEDDPLDDEHSYASEGEDSHEEESEAAEDDERATTVSEPTEHHEEEHEEEEDRDEVEDASRDQDEVEDASHDEDEADEGTSRSDTEDDTQWKDVREPEEDDEAAESEPDESSGENVAPVTSGPVQDDDLSSETDDDSSEPAGPAPASQPPAAQLDEVEDDEEAEATSSPGSSSSESSSEGLENDLSQAGVSIVIPSSNPAPSTPSMDPAAPASSNSSAPVVSPPSGNSAADSAVQADAPKAEMNSPSRGDSFPSASGTTSTAQTTTTADAALTSTQGKSDNAGGDSGATDESSRDASAPSESVAENPIAATSIGVATKAIQATTPNGEVSSNTGGAESGSASLGLTAQTSMSLDGAKQAKGPSADRSFATSITTWLVDSLNEFDLAELFPSSRAAEQALHDAEKLLERTTDLLFEQPSFPWMAASALSGILWVHYRMRRRQEESPAWLELSPGLVDDAFVR